MDIPRTIPYASGQGPRIAVPSALVIVGQVPSLYIASKIYMFIKIKNERRSTEGTTYGTGGRKRCKARPNDSDKPGTEIVSTEKMQSRHLHQTHDT